MQSYKEIPIEQTIKINDNLRLELSTDSHTLFNLVEKNKEQFLNTMKWAKDLKTIEDSKNFIEAWKKGYEQGNKLCYFIMSEDKVAGFFCFRSLDFASKESEIGYMMDCDYQGKGILRKCIQFMLQYAIDRYQIKRFTLATSSNNVRSQNVGLKLGFTLYEREVNGIEINGIVQDLLTYELTKEQYLLFNIQKQQISE